MRKIRFPLIVFLFLALACASTHQKRVNEISTVMDTLSNGYQDSEQALDDAHKAGTLTGDTWNKIVAIRNEASPKIKVLWNDWKAVPATDSAVEAFVASPDFQNALQLVMILAEQAQLPAVTQAKLDSLKRSTN